MLCVDHQHVSDPLEVMLESDLGFMSAYMECDDPDDNVEFFLSETDTLWLVNVTSECVSSTSAEAEALTRRNAAYVEVSS